MAISRRSSAAIGGAVIASWAVVLVDAVHRKNWDGVSAWSHFAAGAFLLTAVGALAGGLAAAFLRLSAGINGYLTNRRSSFARWAEPLLLAVATGGALYTTSFWAFSGERIHRSPIAKWGPYALVLVFALAGAAVSLVLRWGARRLIARRLAVIAVLNAGFISAVLVKVNLAVYPTLYTRFHSLLEFSAAFVFAVASAFCLVSLEDSGALRLLALRRFAAGSIAVLVVFTLVAPTRRWVEEALRHAWREPVYLGRMLSRLQTVEGYVRDPRGWRGSTVPSIIALQKRYDIDSINLGPEWTDHENEPIPLSDRILSLRQRPSYNVVVFYVDTLRADFAKDRRLMPNLARFSEQSLDFRQAYTTGSDTLHAVPGIIGGSYDLFREPKEDLLHAAKTAGYRTSLVAAQSAREFLGRLLPQFQFDDVLPVPDYTPGNGDVWGYGADQPTAARVVDGGIEWLRQNRGTPHLLWLLNFDLHNWREIDESYARRAADLYGLYDKTDPIWRYRAMARTVDAEFGRLLVELQNIGSNEDTVVLFLSDHGEGLGREGFWVHSVFLWQQLIHVPLVLRAPGVQARVVDDPVSLVDVAPTLARFMAARTPTTHFDGQDLLEYAAAAHPKRRHPLVLMGVLNEVPVRLGLIDPSLPYKLVLPLEGAVPELYDLRAEEPDGRDVSRDHPEILLRLLKQLVRAPMFPRPSESASDGPLDHAAADGRAANETESAP